MKKLFLIDEKDILSQAHDFYKKALSGSEVPVILPEKLNFSDLNDIEVPEDADFAVATSGTTGKPRLYFRSLKSWTDFYPVLNKAFGITQKKRIFINGPLSFTGNLNIAVDAVFSGISLYCSSSMRSFVWADEILNNECDIVYMIPDKLLHLCRTGFVFDNVKTVLCGSQKVSENLFEMLKITFPSAKLFSYYGTSEVSYVSYKEITAENCESSLMGNLFEGVSVEITEDNHIVVKSPYCIVGKESFDTGDTGYIKNNQLYFTGRSDDILNVSGEKLNKSVLIERIKRCPGVKECEITLFESSMKKKVKAHIAGKKEKIQVQNIDFSGIPQVFIPAEYVIYDSLPRNASGKIDVAELRIRN